MELKKNSNYQFDVFFVFYSLTLRVKGGREVEFTLLKELAKEGYKVGALFIRDIDHSLYKMIKCDTLKNYNNSKGVSLRIRNYITNNLINSTIGYNLLLPLLRRIYGVKDNSKYFLKGCNIMFGSKVPNKVTAKYFVATGWKTAFFVEKKSTTGRKFHIIHHDERGLNHPLSNLEGQAYALNIDKIVINKAVLETFKSVAVKKITIGINRDKYYLTNKPENHEDNEILVPLRKDPSKGAKYAIEAMKMIHEVDKNVRFTAFGDFPNIQIPDFVNFLGWISDEELIKLYSRAAIIIIPSLLEGFCLPGLEAMACGCTLITTDNIGIREYAENDKNCKIVPVMDPIAIKDASMFLLKNKKFRVNLAYNGAIDASKYNFQRMCNEFKVALGIT
ncbi:MAG: glycosyltransferase family 4 protein [Thermoplasmatales archaeon]